MMMRKGFDASRFARSMRSWVAASLADCATANDMQHRPITAMTIFFTGVPPNATLVAAEAATIAVPGRRCGPDCREPGCESYRRQP
jgi:hypothetical protein